VAEQLADRIAGIVLLDALVLAEGQWVVEMDGGHEVMFTRPRELAEKII